MQYSRCGRMYVLYMRLKSFTSRRLKFLLTIAITRRAVAAAFMHYCDDLKFDDTIMPRSLSSCTLISFIGSDPSVI